MRALFALLLVLSSQFAAAEVFRGGGSYDMAPGDSIVLENNSSIRVAAIRGDYANLEFFIHYNIRKLGLDLFPADFGKNRTLEVVGLRFSTGDPESKPDGTYSLPLSASVLKVNVVLDAVRSGAPVSTMTSVSAASLLSSLSLENAGDLALANISVVFELLRNGEAIFYSENSSAAESLAPGESRLVRLENASWPLVPTAPGAIDNFSFRIIAARNQFEETDYSDNLLLVQLGGAATPTPVPTAEATATPAPSASAQATGSPAATATPTAAAQAEDKGGDALLWAGAAAFLVLLGAAAAGLLLARGPAKPPSEETEERGSGNKKEAVEELPGGEAAPAKGKPRVAGVKKG